MTFSNSLRLSLFLLALTSTSFGALYTSPSQLPQTTFDYVIVGAGTAGNVVANRLSENQNVTVLVLEAGVSNANVTAAIIPLLGPSLVPNTIYDFNYTTTPQVGYNNRVIPYSRGRLLGGSSSANYMVYTRGASDDYDRYAKFTGDSGWGWDNMKEYIKKHEKWVPPADNHDTTGQFTPADHGTNGLLEVSLPGFPTPLDDRVIATTKELSSDFPFIEDNNGGKILGVAWSQGSIGGGARSSSATAYLSDDFLKRPNLHVLINAQVTRLVQTENQNGLPTFHGIEFASKPGGPVSRVNSTKETILSAGTFGSSIILQLSGIGDKDLLEKVNITSTVNLPSVGKNLTDHPLLANVFSAKGSQSFDSIFRTPQNLQSDIGQWTANKTGPLVDGVCNHLGFFRLPPDHDLIKKYGDPSSGPGGGHLEMIISNLWVQPGIPTPDTGSFFTVTTTVIAPTSRGNLQLSSADPWAKPLINTQFLSTDWDKLAMREGVRLATKFMAANSWKDYVIGPYGDFAKANASDEALDTYIANNSATFFHPIGTAMMSPKGADFGVVDPDLKVKGIDGLRVIDGAVLPFLPSAHTQAPIYLIAERGADLVKLDNKVYGLTPNGTNSGKNSGIGLHGRLDVVALALATIASLLVALQMI